MAYYNMAETEKRIAKVREILRAKNLDAALIYFDELNVANGWYLTGWVGQFEKGAVLVGRDGTTMLLGGPESEPFAKQSSAIHDTRCFKVFMVPDEEYPLATIIGFEELFAELNVLGRKGNKERNGISSVRYHADGRNDGFVYLLGASCPLAAVESFKRTD